MLRFYLIVLVYNYGMGYEVEWVNLWNYDELMFK